MSNRNRTEEESLEQSGVKELEGPSSTYSLKKYLSAKAASYNREQAQIHQQQDKLKRFAQIQHYQQISQRSLSQLQLEREYQLKKKAEMQEALRQEYDRQTQAKQMGKMISKAEEQRYAQMEKLYADLDKSRLEDEYKRRQYELTSNYQPSKYQSPAPSSKVKSQTSSANNSNPEQSPAMSNYKHYLKNQMENRRNQQQMIREQQKQKEKEMIERELMLYQQSIEMSKQRNLQQKMAYRNELDRQLTAKRQAIRYKSIS